MVTELEGALGQAVMITAFVAVMMMAVEYLNVLTRGTLEGALRGSPALQYLAAALLGATPGCLGAFTVVALYSHRVVTVGALVATMIATSGDEAFVMLGLCSWGASRPSASPWPRWWTGSRARAGTAVARAVS